MKNAALLPLRVNSATRAAAESVLHKGKTLSGFVLEAVRLNIEQHEAQREFITRGLQAREEARATGDYVSAEDMLARLDASLARACSKRKTGARHPGLSLIGA